jgi:hypothetical protein
MTPDSRILPCPARNDWKATLAELQGRRVILGAIHDHAYEYDRDGLPTHEVDQIWGRLGSHANATLDEVDVPRFAGAVGLLSPDKNNAYPADWRLSTTYTWRDEEPAWQDEDPLRGPGRLDTILRGLPDTRSFGVNKEQQDRIERRYGEDDL